MGTTPVSITVLEKKTENWISLKKKVTLVSHMFEKKNSQIMNLA